MNVLQCLCDILEHNDPQLYVPNPHSLEINKSNELLNGLKELYKQSSDSEQTRLMTIAPLSWGRVMLSKWFGCSDHHGRQAILLRQEPINVYYLNSITIDDIIKTLLSNRFKQLNGKKYSFCILRRKLFFLGRIIDIRQFHQFDPKNQFTIFCRKTSTR